MDTEQTKHTDRNNNYIISLDHFEGPLDLLHQLIERRKLQINTVSLGKVTADYLAYIRERASVPVEEVSRFIHTASILILIKSKSLLPLLEYTKEEERDVAVLENRMHALDFVRKRAMPALERWSERVSIIPPMRQAEETAFRPCQFCTVEEMVMRAKSAANEFVFLKKPPKKRVGTTIRIEEVINRVISAVTDRMSVSFKKLSGSSGKKETIVSFLAVLELVRKDLLSAEQGDRFGDIMIKKSGADGDGSSVDGGHDTGGISGGTSAVGSVGYN